jgi:hypothetical protein
MKVIVIGDNDGHINAYAYNHANLLALLRFAEEAGMIEVEIPDNPTMEQLEFVVVESPWINHRGAQFSIIDVKDNCLIFNPFE